jgi:uncharacterized membrane protein
MIWSSSAVAQGDALWFEDQQRYGWVMPQAPWWKRMSLVRRVRYAWLCVKAETWARGWAAAGIGCGMPSQYDRWVLYGIVRGFERPAT